MTCPDEPAYIVSMAGRGVLKGILPLLDSLLAFCTVEKHLASRDGMTNAQWSFRTDHGRMKQAASWG